MKTGPDLHQMNRRAMLSSLAGCSVLMTGCPLAMPESLPGDTAQSSITDQPIGALVAETLQIERQTRGLSTMVNGAWQIFHGILAYGSEFEVDTPTGRQIAIDYFRDGGTCNGFQPSIGDRIGNTDRFGLRVDIQPTTKVGQGHRDQWLAVIAQAGLTVDATWKVRDEVFTIDDWLHQAELDIPLNYEEEFSWTLIPLSYFRPTDYRWKARDGKTYSTEVLLEVEIEHDLEASVCGGTHRLIGIATAVRNRVAEGKTLTGVWKDARSRLDGAIEMARVNQNPDGSYSTSYMHRSGWCNDLGETLGTTGHVLEFLAMSADRETLQSEWVQRSVYQLCDVLRQCRGVDLECGVLYHALHGLVEYQRQTA
ncbi:MAG: hypothetical protein KDB00_25110 [Planctomycetales bacterium]|nr:hypothetical protein [Planctomycetales bacterium]